MQFEDYLQLFIERAIEEDVGSADLTTNAIISANQKGTAQLVMKTDGVIAGVQLAEQLFTYLDNKLIFKAYVKDGDSVCLGDVVFSITGAFLSILTGERVVLNCLQRMSGIATLVAQLKQQIIHTSTQILDTRKTSPCARVIDKWAVRIGGGDNHRFGLYDEILVKDNHIDACGGIEYALEKLNEYHQNHQKIPVIVECRDESEWNHVLDRAPYVKRVLLDNMSPNQLSMAVNKIDGRTRIEASGNINPTNLVSYAETGVDFLSMGMITHSINVLDMSLKIKNQ